MGKNSKLSLLLLAALDILVVNIGFAAAFKLRFGPILPHYNFDPYVSLIPWLSITAFIVFYMFDLYANWQRKSIYNLVYTIFLAILVLTLCTMALTFWWRGFAFPRSVILITPAVQVLLLALSRSLVWLLGKQVYGRKRVLIVGVQPEDGISMAKKFMEHDQGWFVVQEFLALSEINKLEAKLQKVDVVLLCPTIRDKVEIINRCAAYDKEVLVVPEIFELFVLGSEPQQIDDMPVLSIKPPGLNSAQCLMKRLFDIVFSLVSLVVLSPVMLVLIILIRATSPGSALFKQERLGRNGKPYQIIKFRSMVNDAEKQTGPVLATDKDPRITPIGRFIRATRLDELPQLVNVLLGDMSIVGPRPERKFFTQKFELAIPHYSYRGLVKPGVTGLAQVMAKYSTTVEDKLRFDLMYVRNYSLALDFKILFQTIRVVLQGEQAAGVKLEDETNRENLMRMFG